MAKTSLKVKQSRPAKFSTREYTRCERCGRPNSVLSMPYLLQRTRLQGRNSWSKEGKLVIRRKRDYEYDRSYRRYADKNP